MFQSSIATKTLAFQINFDWKHKMYCKTSLKDEPNLTARRYLFFRDRTVEAGYLLYQWILLWTNSNVPLSGVTVVPTPFTSPFFSRLRIPPCSLTEVKPIPICFHLFEWLLFFKWPVLKGIFCYCPDWNLFIVRVIGFILQTRCTVALSALKTNTCDECSLCPWVNHSKAKEAHAHMIEGCWTLLCLWHT